MVVYFCLIFQKLLDEDDVKVAADAMKELEMFMPSVSGTDSKSSKSRWVTAPPFSCLVEIEISYVRDC